MVVLCLLALILCLRMWRLEADPPATVSGSTDIYTDPPQYTLFAKNYVENGEFTPFNDTRFVFFLESSVTALATVVFKLFGTGITQAKLVGLLYSFGGLLFFFLFWIFWPNSLQYPYSLLNFTTSNIVIWIKS